MKQITVTIDPGGASQIETNGFSGSDCIKETADLQAKLGTTTSDTKTREAFRTATTTNTAKAGR